MIEEHSHVMKTDASEVESILLRLDPEIVKTTKTIHEKIAKIMSVNNQGTNFRVYETNHGHNLHPNNNLTFLISPAPFELPVEIQRKLEIYGQSISAFYQTCDSIFRELPENHKWRKILTNNRPEWLLKKAQDEHDNTSHVFLRPDFILTEDGVVTTEIETSPFGLALALFLHTAYSEESKPSSQLIDTFIAEIMGNDKGKNLCFMITEHTKKYRGQFEYLAKLLTKEGINALIATPDDINIENQESFINGKKVDVLYRGFYLHEAVEDEKILSILQSNLEVHPGFKSHLEEKAMMAMFFDDELDHTFRSKLGNYYDILKDIFPPTYVLRDIPPKVLGINSWEELSNIARNKRSFILKISGFSELGSWVRGVTCLNKLSQQQCQEVIQAALASEDVFVIQEFKKGKTFQQEYYDFENSVIKTMNGRVRFTPYFSAKTGQLLTAKTTMCENTDFIHATTNSINSPIQ